MMIENDASVFNRDEYMEKFQNACLSTRNREVSKFYCLSTLTTAACVSVSATLFYQRNFFERNEHIRSFDDCGDLQSPQEYERILSVAQHVL